MIITKKILASMLIKYINRRIDMSDLVDWGEELFSRNSMWSFSMRDVITQRHRGTES